MNLVMSAVGKKGLHNQWINGDYDLVLIHYEEQGKNYKEGRVTHIFKEGFKFPMIKEYLEKCKKEYDYYLFLDDDIILSADSIEELFNYAKILNLKVFTPAINPINMPNKAPQKEEGCLFRYVSWIEVQSVGMNKNTLDILLDTFDLSDSGWGLPDKWKSILPEINAFAIIDVIESYHTKPMDYSKGIYAKIGFKNLWKKYIKDVEGIDTEFKVFQRFYTNPLLSVCTIFCDEDMELLTQQFETIPEWSEHVLVRTVPEPIETPYIKSKEVQGNKVWIEYCYPENNFNFADATNISIENATGFYFLKLDADERLLKHQHDGLLRAIESIMNTDKDCISFWTLSCMGGGKNLDVAKQTRLWKNLPYYRFEGAAHEHIKVPSDFENKILDSDFKIDHIGYDYEPDIMKKKMIRNIRGMLKNPEILLNTEEYFNTLIRDCSSLKEVNNYLELIKGK